MSYRPTIRTLNDLERFVNIAEIVYKIERIFLPKRAERFKAEVMIWATGELNRLT